MSIKKTYDELRFTDEIESAVMDAREHKEWRFDYVSLMEKLRDEREEGIAIGEDRGRREGLLKGMWSLVNSGIISSAVAAQQCSMTEEAFLKTKPQAV